MKAVLGIFSIILIGVLGIIAFKLHAKNPSVIQHPASEQKTEIPKDTPLNSVVTTHLEIPWEFAFLPNGDALFTERPGEVKLLQKGGSVKTIFTIPDVLAQGEGGLLGITIDPHFQNNHYVYLYYTYGSQGENTRNRVVRYTFSSNTFTGQKILLNAIPGAFRHNGGRLKFGPDGYLYITSGDSLQPSLAQNTKSLAGKILRITSDGKPAPDNPFGNEVYSYGHRNPQGLAWDSTGQLWETEHGNNNHDEVNKIEKGKNYGWPIIEGRETRTGMVAPVIESGNDTWAPSGAVIYNNALFFTGLRGSALYEFNLSSQDLITHFQNEFGRLRDIEITPDSLFYILTNNTDGRGTPGPDDDKIIQVNPEKL